MRATRIAAGLSQASIARASTPQIGPPCRCSGFHGPCANSEGTSRSPARAEVADGVVLGPSGRKAKGLIVQHDHGFRPGIPAQRLADMDRDGIYTHVIYGPPNGLPIADVELRTACLRAYNDWANEFNAVDRNRL